MTCDSLISNHYSTYNEYHGQRQRYELHIANVSNYKCMGCLAKVICIVVFGRDIHYKAIQHFRFSCIIALS